MDQRSYYTFPCEVDINDSFTSPVLFTRRDGVLQRGKSEWSLSPYIDYKGLNEITTQNKYPLPLIHSAVGSLPQATIFSQLNAHNVYHLVRISQKDEWQTAFMAPGPLWLSGHVLQPHQFTHCFPEPGQRRSLWHAEARSACLVGAPTSTGRTVVIHYVGFLGFINECGQVRTDPSKVQVMTDWPVPEIHKLLQYFLGFDNFYRNVSHDFSSVAALLTPLTSTKLSSLCSPETEESFVWPPVQGWGGRLRHWSRSSVCGSVRWQTTQP